MTRALDSARIPAGAVLAANTDMYPVLFDFNRFNLNLTLNTYDVMWLLALSLAILWSVRRFPLYGFCTSQDDANARKVIGGAFVAMLFGARAFEYIINFQDYVNDPSLLLDLNHGSLSEIGAFCGAFLGALVISRCKKISLERLCGVAALPAFLAMAIGRWGCFLNGCCVGVIIPESIWSAVHFPRDAAGVLRHPTQLYYSVSAAFCLAGLFMLERTLLRRELLLEIQDQDQSKFQASARAGLITSVGLMLLTAMRFFIDPLRAASSATLLGNFRLSHGVLLACLPLELIWIGVSIRRLRRAKS